jgi:hypothetical protein
MRGWNVMARYAVGSMVARWSVFLALVALSVCALPGCGSDLGATVSGTVTLDGKRVGPGMVTFVPVEGATNPADGAIQIDGSYSLKTGREVGLKPGRYRASATILDQPDVKPGERSYEAPKLVTPQKYSDPSTSGLEYDVKPGSNTIDVPLSSK